MNERKNDKRNKGVERRETDKEKGNGQIMKTKGKRGKGNQI